ncbi:MAG: DUF2007 domain-containing protein [Sedimentisphaerales bacterium]
MADKLVTIAEYMDSMQAEMARQVLEDFDIKAVVIGENAANTCLAPTVITAKLQVLEKDAEEAKQILEDQEQGFEPGEFSEFNELGGYEEPEEQ